MSNESTDAQKTPQGAGELDALLWGKSARDVTAEIGLAKLLTSLQFLATDSARDVAVAQKWDGDTPASMQVIKSGTLEITKRWTKLVSNAGGGATVLATVAAVVSGVREDVGDPVTVALIGFAALLASATAIALAIFVSGDLEARGRATAARHTARGEVAAAFLAATAQLEGKPSAAGQAAPDLSNQILQALAAFPGRVFVSTQDAQNEGTQHLVTGIRRRADGQSSVYVVDDWVPLQEVTSFSTGAVADPASEVGGYVIMTNRPSDLQGR